MRTAKLKDITLTITDGKHGDCKNHDGSGYYFISCKDVYDETIHYENARQITEDGYWKVNILKEYIYVESRREDA